ncbi:MAG TPA: HAD family hydrolase [Candidatus Brocadiia bacterium]|nr:HAD family phosphatase [Candidatus Brocadiales bacterium]
MKNKKTIIFDMDGVISDSMPFHAKAWKEAFAPIGINVEDIEIYIREGMKGKETIEDIIKERNLSISQEEMEQIYKRKREAFNRIFEVKLMPGIYGLLNGLRMNGHRLALVTGSCLEATKAVLSSLAARRSSPESEVTSHWSLVTSDVFDVVIAGEMVANGKPDPEPYLKAVSMLGVKKEDCLVIENAPAGITSAKRAGLRCYAVATSLPKTYLKEADMVFDNIKEISDYLLNEHYIQPASATITCKSVKR